MARSTLGGPQSITWGIDMEIITRKEAQRQGLQRYFTGKPCTRGHIDTRLTSVGQCLACNKQRYEENIEQIKERGRQWRQKNKEHKRAIDKEYRKNNREKVRQGWRDWVKRNKVHHDKVRRDYYEKNKERIISAQKQYLKNNPDLRKKISLDYYYRNKDKVDALNRLRQKQVKIATPLWYNSSAVRLKMKERDTMTRLTGLKYHVDHRIPLQGENVCGLHVAENLRVILARDNLSKSNKWETQ